MFRLFSWPCLDLVSFAGNSGYTDGEESQNEKRRKNVVELPAKIKECAPHPSLLWTSDKTLAPLGVFVRQIITNPVPYGNKLKNYWFLL